MTWWKRAASPRSTTSATPGAPSRTYTGPTSSPCSPWRGRDISEPRADFAFSLRDAAELDAPGRRFTLTPDEITRLNPDTGTCPVFRTRRDAGITLEVYRRVPVLGHADAPWGITFTRMFDMSVDAGLFHRREELERDGWRLAGNVFTRGQDRMLPLYQGIMASFYDHRAADVARSRTAGPRQHLPRYLTPAEKDDPARTAMPAFWVDASQADASQAGGLGPAGSSASPASPARRTSGRSCRTCCRAPRWGTARR